MGDFNPSKYLSKVSGQDYLEVKWRLVWLRDSYPDAAIESNLLEHIPGELAVFKATISVPGMGSASGHGSEMPKDFKDYLEKAETKAIGRALAALGFGTQFCDDFADGHRSGRPVDAPVRTSATSAAVQPNGNIQVRSATANQIHFIEELEKRTGIQIRNKQTLTFDEASSTIELLKEEELNKA